jgi:predicted kinase
MLCGSVREQSKNKIVFDKIKEFLDFRLSCGVKYTVIDATNLRFNEVRDYLDIAGKYHTPVTIISIDPPSVEELRRRTLKRGNEGGLVTPFDILEKHHERYYSQMNSFIKNEITLNYKFVRVGQDLEIL